MLRFTRSLKQKIAVLAFGLLPVTLLTLTALNYSSTSNVTYDKIELREALLSDFNDGNYDQLIQSSKEVLQVEPKNIEALIALSITYAMKGSIEFTEKENGIKAIEYADQALALEPGNSEAYRVKGYAYEIQELYDLAHQNYDKAIELNPKNFQALSNKGHAYDLQGDFEKAEKYYELSKMVYPQSEHLLLNLSRLYFKHGKLEDSIKSIQRLASTSKNLRLVAEGYQILAEIYRNQNKYEEAKSTINSSLALSPNVPQTWVTRGRILYDHILKLSTESDIENQLISIKESAERALTLNPNQATAYALLADLMIIKSDNIKREEYRQLALQAAERDITLGVNEKNALKRILSIEIIVAKGLPKKIENN